MDIFEQSEWIQLLGVVKDHATKQKQKQKQNTNRAKFVARDQIRVGIKNINCLDIEATAKIIR